MGGRRAGTRDRIREVALEMFVERGYEATSLREIAERLGVTKAALYYHFKTKEEIIVSLVEDVRDSIAELVDWVRGEPPGPATRREAVIRFLDQIQNRHGELVGMAQRNQPKLRDLKVGHEIREVVLALADAMAGPDAVPLQTFRARLALTCASMGIFASEGLDLGESPIPAIADAAASLLIG